MSHKPYPRPIVRGLAGVIGGAALVVGGLLLRDLAVGNASGTRWLVLLLCVGFIWMFAPVAVLGRTLWPWARLGPQG